MFTGVASFGQSFPTGIDSIDQKLAMLPNDTLKVQYVFHVAENMCGPHPAIIPYIKAAMEIVRHSGSRKRLADAYSMLGKAYYFNVNMSKAIIYTKKAIVLYKSLHDYANLFHTYHLCASAYFYLGQYDLSIIENKRSLALAKKLSDTTGLIIGNREIGYNYLRLEEPDSAISYLRKALSIGLKKGSELNNAYTFSEIGNYYNYLHQPARALKYHFKALKIACKENHIHSIVLASNRIASSYLTLNQPDSALKYLNKVLKYHGLKTHNISCRIAAEIFMRKNNFRMALAYLDTARLLNQKIQNFDRLDTVYSLYSKIYQKSGNLNKVLFYNNLRFANFDSIIQRILHQQYANIQILTDIDAFEAENARLLHQQEMKELKLHRYRLALLTGIIFTLIILGFLLLLYKSLKKIEYKNNIISEQKDELQAQAEELRLQSEELQKHKERLEEIVEERTKDLIIAKEKAEESDQLKTAFLNNISHEFRTPLNAILGFSDLLADYDLSTTEKKSFNEIIKRSGHQLLNIVNDTIEISQVQRHQLRLVLSPVNIKELIDMVVQEFVEPAAHKGLELLVELDFPGEVPVIITDREKLSRIFWHLLNNAIKFTLKGFIKLSGEWSDNQRDLVFRIEDTGIGVPDDMQEKIFEAYRQVETGATRRFGGNGIGLTLVKAYVELLEGKITLTSKEGKGTVIIFTIPVKKQ